MALFLPAILTVSGLATNNGLSDNGRSGILGGPSAITADSESYYRSDKIGLFQSTPSPTQDNTSPFIESGYGAMENALLVANNQVSIRAISSSKPTTEMFSKEGPDLKGYFSLPAQGFNWGKLHPYNAVDIANACGTSIFATAEGLVNEMSLDSWSDGYGHYVMISHPNGTKARYAHMQKIFVSVGQYVKKGELIGTMGRTGDATGCHVHFEVIGAANPFAR